jgi:hypothetical protein
MARASFTTAMSEMKRAFVRFRASTNSDTPSAKSMPVWRPNRVEPGARRVLAWSAKDP